MTDTGRKLREKSFMFATCIVKLAKSLENERKDRTLSRQILRSGTSIGANIRESRFAQSPSDFISKLSIALKEAEETQYWLELLLETDYLARDQYTSLNEQVDWLIGTLVNVVKSSKRNLRDASRDCPPTKT